MNTLERCPHCNGEGYVVPHSAASQVADQEWRETKAFTALIGATLGLTGALALGGPWSAGFFFMIVGFVVGAVIAAKAEKNERYGKATKHHHV